MGGSEKLKAAVRTVEDFPKEGVLFYDVAPLLEDPALFRTLVDELAEPLQHSVDKLVAFDARGFLFAGAVALETGIGFGMLRKPGKLPGEVAAYSYDLEYGSNQLEIQTNTVQPGERIALIDDVIATGGTALAGIELVRRLGGNVVSFNAVIDLPHLGGSEKIHQAGVPVNTLMVFGADDE